MPKLTACGRVFICLSVLAVTLGGSVARLPAQTHPFPNRIDAPDFPPEVDWLNSGPLTKQELKGKFVLLDFWTYCCINCMHILPELHKLEQQLPNNLVVVGVHSAKFDAERVTDNIRAAILRYEIAHPVINDENLQLWKSYGVNIWPTIVLIDPAGQIVWRKSGEFKAEEVAKTIRSAMGYYRSRRMLDQRPIKLAPESASGAETPLRFPGKILADEAGNRLFISDTNHNRIVVATLAGELLEVIGSGPIGRKDGDYRIATFNHPQGCAVVGDALYIADTGNHLLRKVDLARKVVVTVAGTGEQGFPIHAFPGWNGQPLKAPRSRWTGRPATTKLSSPWALASHDGDLLIAMAGYHQIWKMPLDGKEIGPLTGNGREDVVDGPRALALPFEGGSSFAQPSGLSVGGDSLFVADSEGSSIRSVELKGEGKVGTVIGTSHLPKDRLFTFGDRDGPRDTALLQHCLEVVAAGETLYVADTYNHKIKAVSLQTGVVRTLAGTGRPGNGDEPAEFHEPGGLALAGGTLYIADTNNHSIRTLNLATGRVQTLPIPDLRGPLSPAEDAPTAAGSAPAASSASAVTRILPRPNFEGANREAMPLTRVGPADGAIQLDVNLRLPAGWKINPLAPMSYWVDSPRASGPIDRAAFGRNPLKQPAAEFLVPLRVNSVGKDEIRLSLNYYYCQTKDEGVCKMGAVVFSVPLEVVSDGVQTPVKVTHTIRE